MKPFRLLLLLMLPLLFAACSGKEMDETYYPESEYVPILMKYDDIVNSVKQMPARQIEQTGKICIYNEYIFVVDKYKGFHVINNSNPASPVIEAFMSVPGCVDIAVKDDFVYADNAIDLVSINITDKTNMYESARIPNIFPELLPPNNSYIPYWFNKENRPLNTVIVGWKNKTETL